MGGVLQPLQPDIAWTNIKSTYKHGKLTWPTFDRYKDPEPREAYEMV